MRQIATLPDEVTARKFTDYLLTLKIATRLLPEGTAVGVWVCDEDRVPQARQELEKFQQQPQDSRYTQAVPVAKELRHKEERLEKDYRRRTTRLRQRMEAAGTGADRPLTITLITISVLVTLTSSFGQADSAITQALSIAPFGTEQHPMEWAGLSTIASGQVWRLVTPIFLHFNVLHLLFNCLMLLQLGGPVESLRGTTRYLMLVLALAVFSNLSEYYLHWNINASPPLIFDERARFGGLSGVIYGLFGYIWMKSRYDPTTPFRIRSDTVVILLGWFVLCFLNVIPKVANIAHAAGLVLGMVVGVLPRLWKR